MELQVPGVHNVKNALAAAASAIALRFPAAAVEEGLAAFRGAGRRFEHKGSFHGAEVYDDYAHHPGELQALFSAVKGMGYARIICAFQPHTYTRTRALFSDFVQVLREPDLTILAEIYAARETDTLGVSSRDLAEQIPGSRYCATREKSPLCCGRSPARVISSPHRGRRRHLYRRRVSGQTPVMSKRAYPGSGSLRVCPRGHFFMRPSATAACSRVRGAQGRVPSKSPAFTAASRPSLPRS